MSLGILMLVHAALDRAEQVARHWARAGCPVVIHVDRAVSGPACKDFMQRLSDVPEIRFSRRHRCEWGTWGLVAASQDAAELMLRDFPDIRHVCLTSGTCLPLRPVAELTDYLARRPRTDFIESATTADVPWTVGGLDYERFSLHFPFSWRRHRLLFDRFVDLQRRFGLRRKIPDGIVPHMGSQWWCLTRQTLSAILRDPERPRFDRYFRHVWIPDESYFQTLARRHCTHIESRSLTLSRFDFQGKPHIFYDDHLQLLRRSDCFVARKIWPGAEGLYRAFLSGAGTAAPRQDPDPGRIDRVFAQAAERRTRGRAGLCMQSRQPNPGWENGVTATGYSVFHGFTELFQDFEGWLARATGTQVHGHLYAPARAEFHAEQKVTNGALSDNARLRDANPMAFLTNLIWNARGTRQCFQYGPRDNPHILWHIAHDPNATLGVIAGAWAVPLFRSGRDIADLRAEAAHLQRTESGMLHQLRSPDIRARIRIWTLAEVTEAPMEPLHTLIGEMGRKPFGALTEAPVMEDLRGFGQFLRALRNQGMHPHIIGDFPEAPPRRDATPPRPKPYLVRA